MTHCAMVVISWENLYLIDLYIDNTLYILSERSTTSNYNDMFDGIVSNISCSNFFRICIVFTPSSNQRHLSVCIYHYQFELVLKHTF